MQFKVAHVLFIVKARAMKYLRNCGILGLSSLDQATSYFKPLLIFLRTSGGLIAMSWRRVYRIERSGAPRIFLNESVVRNISRRATSSLN
jgi:hypothetical protein